MASLEKLVKALESIKVFQPDIMPTDTPKKKDQPLSKKDKITNCNSIADCMCSSGLRNIGEFPKFLGIAMETFLLLCDDADSDVRMVADECLNRTIKTLLESNLGRVQVELYKEIKKNGLCRSLRAALWRFADLCHLIRPQKCRPYVVNLLPCLARICRRPEESIQDTLATAMTKICPVLMGFTNDIEVKVLLKAFIPNLRSSSASARRTAASSLALLCQFCRKPTTFLSYLLNTLLAMVVPVDQERDVYMLLGVLLALRHITPHLAVAEEGQGQTKTQSQTSRESPANKAKDLEMKIELSQLIQLYEVLLYYLDHPDHNVITASLETLQQLLRTTPPALLKTLLTDGSISRTSILENDLAPSLINRVESQARLPSVSDDTGLEDDDCKSEITEGSAVTAGSDIAGDSNTDSGLSAQGSLDSARRNGSIPDSAGKSTEDEEPFLLDNDDIIETQGQDDGEFISPDQSEELDPPEIIDIMQSSMTTEEDYTSIEIGEMSDDKGISQSSSMDTLSEIKNSLRAEDKLRKGASQECLSTNSTIDEIQAAELDDGGVPNEQGLQATTTLRPGEIGSITCQDPPLLYCARVLCSKFLLTGYKNGLISDRQVRVSVKALALGCTGCIAALYPRVIMEKLHKSSSIQGELQDIRDILLYASHCDPQLKATTGLLVGNFLWAGLRISRGSLDIWIKKNNNSGFLSASKLVSVLISLLEDDSSVTSRQALIALRICLVHLLNSSHSDLGLKVILTLLRLKESSYWLVKVELLDLLGNVDFKVVEYLEGMHEELRKGSNHYMGMLSIQNYVLTEIFLPFLGDEDMRVRHASANAIVSIIPRLFYPVDHPQHDPVVAKAKQFTTDYLEPIMHDWSQPPEPLIHGLVKPFHFNLMATGSVSMEAAMSRVISKIVETLTKSSSKYLTYGCVHALCLLSRTYYVTQFATGWCCSPLSAMSGPLASKSSATRKTRAMSGSMNASVSSASSASSSYSMQMSIEDLPSGSGGGPLGVVLALMVASPIAFDLSTHQDALKLAGNLFAGAAYKCMRSAEEAATSGSDDQRWLCLTDRLLVPMADQLLTHVARLLSISTHILEEQSPGPPQTKTALPSLPNAPSLSPIKRKAKGVKDEGTGAQANQGDKGTAKTPSKDSSKDSDSNKGKSKDGLGTFYHIPHYMKLYESLRGAYSNYKVSLDMNSSEKFGGMLRTALEVLAQLLEVAGIPEMGKYTEELLTYLKSTVMMEDTSSILCVQQLLKALFGTNLSSQWESSHNSGSSRKPGKATRLTSNIRPGLYHCCFTTPYTQFTQCLAGATFRSTTHAEQDDSYNLINWMKKRAEKRVPAIMKPGSKTDKASVAAYIRLFEPLVIKALKQYTITSSLPLQQQVLNLLAQLVQLRVNYCLLDSDQIFIGFVIKQFEIIEEGQIRNSQSLVPHIFNFLVLLSYERYHSKSVISMPKIIQLCDGLLASGLDPNTHAIPALQCIVHDLFVLRAINKADAGKEIDTQREVVVSMLLRLIKYHQVLELFILVLHQCRKDGEDRWKRLSRQVIDTVLPLLAKQEMNLDSQEAMDVVHRLFEAVAPSVFRPVDILLKTLFSSPPNLGQVVYIQRWLCQLMILLRALMNQSKEEVVLSRLQELGLGVSLTKGTVQRHREQGKDETLQATPIVTCSSPEETMARFLLQVVGVVAAELSWRMATLTCEETLYRFLCQELSHLLLYVTHMFQSGIYRKVATYAMSMIRKESPPEFFSIQEINVSFKDMAISEPTLTLQWCNILILLNYEDQSWWSEVLQTPRKYVLGSPSDGPNPLQEATFPCNNAIHLEVVRRGGLILFCDYVCENLNDAEHVTWVVINHVNDLIHLSHEPPVQDFISAIHRNSAASGLFIQAIHSRCEQLPKPSLVKKTLHCLEAIHLSQSGALLTLLIDKFLHTPHLAVARGCDTVACRRVEMLLAENFQESSQQLPLEDLERLLQFMKSHGLTKRYSRLASLLNKHRMLLCPESKLTLSPEKTHPLAIATNSVTDITIDKMWYVSIVRDQCYSPTASHRECAQLLQHLDYTNILNIIMAKECNLGILEECISLGTQRTLAAARLTKEGIINAQQMGDQSPYPQNSPSREKALDPLLQASQLTLFRHLNNLINLLPVPHQLLSFSSLGPDSKEEHYREKMEDLFTDITWFDTIFQLTNALLQYLVSLPQLPWELPVPEESTVDIARFSILAVELLHWMLQHDQYPTSEQMQAVFECLAVTLRHPQLQAVIGQKERTTWACSAIRAVHQYLSSVLVLPGCKLVTLPHQDSQEDPMGVGFDDFHYAVRACDQISELIHCLRTHLCAGRIHPKLPTFLAPVLRNIIIGLARLPLVNSYARTPPLVWKLGWLPSPTGDMKTCLPPLPLDYLMEKDVLKEFIFRVNILGWTSRQQFEETWMSLLGVLNPIHLTEQQQQSAEEDIDRCQCAVLATRCITALLVQSSLTPQSGNPCNSSLDHQPRDKPLAFLHTKVGKKLVHIRCMIEHELQTLARIRSDQDSHHMADKPGMLYEQHKHLLVSNAEKEWGCDEFGHGQLSVESVWSLLGMLDPGQAVPGGDSGSDSATDTASSPDTPLSPHSFYPPLSKINLTSDIKKRSYIDSGLDIHSCLQFLLELFKQLLSPDANPRTPLMQYNETIKAAVVLSDQFTEKQQYGWLLETLLEVSRTHAMEDEIVLQYVVVGMCKTAAVIGVEAPVFEKVVKMLELCMKSTHLPTKVSALYGALYLLETGVPEVVSQVIPLLTDYLYRTLSSITHTTIHSMQHVLVMWAVTLYILENYHTDIKDPDFMPRTIQLCMSTVSSGEDLTPLPIYLTILRGLERLLLADVLTKHDAEQLIKLSVDRLCLPSPQRALAALALMLTCMYSGKQGDQWTPTRILEQPDFSLHEQVSHDPESLIVAMERVTALFDRIRKGFPYEARVITRILPSFLADFFPPQDIMNKVIGEFLSNQQPHPQLMASVVFQVFEQLLERQQQALVQDWVMLSLSNFTQRSPVAMAIWSLTCFFISASNNRWLRTLLPHLLGRMGMLDQVDIKLFCISALDFWQQITDGSHKRAFVSTFQAVAKPDTPYTQLLACLTS